MTEIDISYSLIASLFVIMVTLLPTVGLRIDYVSTRKPYLFFAFIAGILAIARQVPDALLGQYPDSSLFFLASSCFQFLASLFLLVALLKIDGELGRKEKVLLTILVLAWASVAVYLLLFGLPQSMTVWYLVSVPVIAVSLLIFVQLFRVSLKSSSSRILLLISSFVLLGLRVAIPGTSSIEMVYLIYFLEVVLFPVLLTALHLSEVQSTHEKVKALLRRRIQSEANVQFILDHSMDIIVAVNSAGLLTTWNKVAEAKFGYTADQAIGKVHIDDFFVDHYFHSDVEEYKEFDAWMENVDGETISVRARIKTITEGNRSYTIYMLRDLSAIGEMGKNQVELEREAS